MEPTYLAYNTKFVTTSGTGVLGATGQPTYLQAVYSSQASAQGVAFYSGTTLSTLAIVTLPARAYTQLPISAPGGLTFQTVGNPGDGALNLTFFWVPG